MCSSRETVMKNLRENFLQGQEKSGQQEKPESPSEDGRVYYQKGEGKQRKRKEKWGK